MRVEAGVDGWMVELNVEFGVGIEFFEFGFGAGKG